MLDPPPTLSPLRAFQSSLSFCLWISAFSYSERGLLQNCLFTSLHYRLLFFCLCYLHISNLLFIFTSASFPHSIVFLTSRPFVPPLSCFLSDLCFDIHPGQVISEERERYKCKMQQIECKKHLVANPSWCVCEKLKAPLRPINNKSQISRFDSKPPLLLLLTTFPHL